MYNFDNPDLPTLQPWMLTNPPPATRFVFERNPYFHRVDPNGQQLPYIDRGRVRRGRRQADPDQDRRRRDRPAVARPVLQALHLPEGERGAQRPGDPSVDRRRRARIWRCTPISTPRTRSGASCSATSASGARCRSAIDRDEINQIMYFGLGIGGNNTVLPQSPLYKPEYREQLGRATISRRPTRCSTRSGSTERSADGLRLLPDGRPMEMVVETAGEETEQADILELVHEAWLQLGIKIHTRPSQREVFRNRIFSGETLMSIWYGLENGIPTRRHEPGRVRADQPAAAAVADVGPVPRDQGPGRRGAGHAGGGQAARAVRGLAGGAPHRGAAHDLGRDPRASTATRSIRSG